MLKVKTMQTKIASTLVNSEFPCHNCYYCMLFSTTSVTKYKKFLQFKNILDLVTETMQHLLTKQKARTESESDHILGCHKIVLSPS